VADYAQDNSIPWITFGKDDDKLAVMTRICTDRPLPAPHDWPRSGGAGVPAGVVRGGGTDLHEHLALVVLQGRPAEHLQVVPFGNSSRLLGSVVGHDGLLEPCPGDRLTDVPIGA
jgi:hypothetical protein